MSAMSNAGDSCGTHACRAMRRICLLIVLAAACVDKVSPSAAASAAGSIDGQTTDALQRPLADVQLHVEAPDGITVGRAVSDVLGHFILHGVSPGTYSVIAEKPGFDTATIIVTLDKTAGATADLVLASKQALDLNVTAKKLDEARNAISPRIGASVYEINRQAIENAPQGDNASFNQVLLQAPGVAQDSFGQLHVRGDHANLQYRINGVLLPEGISGFGQVLDSRFANSADLITGALPAQYGYRTAGVIDIQTKSGAFDRVNSIGMYGGSYGTLQPSFETMGSSGGADYYLSGSFLQNDIGIESPTGDPDTIHDRSRQTKGFLYASDLLDPSTRLSVIAGTSIGNFQIPNNPNQQPQLGITAFGQSSFASASLNENQRERNDYGILALQQSRGDLDYQVAAFTRLSSVNFTPDTLGDLIFNGVAAKVYRKDFTNGLQGDGSYKLTNTHTLRGGLFTSGERALSRNFSVVEPVVAGAPVDAPFGIQDDNTHFGWLYGAYLQDEWRLTPELTLNYGARVVFIDEIVRAPQISPRIKAV